MDLCLAPQLGIMGRKNHPIVRVATMPLTSHDFRLQPNTERETCLPLMIMLDQTVEADRNTEVLITKALLFMAIMPSLLRPTTHQSCRHHNPRPRVIGLICDLTRMWPASAEIHVNPSR